MLVDFYHLASPIERVLPRIGEKIVGEGARLLIVAESDLLDQLDVQLWSYAPEAFLPHGRSDGRTPETQPILLSTQVQAVNGASNIALADGQWREEALQFERAFFFFDNGRRDAAREQWRALKSNPEAELRYWKQDERGKWVQGP